MEKIWDILEETECLIEGSLDISHLREEISKSIKLTQIPERKWRL